MDEETKQLLREDLEIARESKKLLNELVRHQKLATWLNVIKWIVVIGTALGALYYVQPILENLLGTYNELLSGVSSTSVKVLPGQY